MQTWHCIALLVLSVGIFFYATYLRDVEKNTTLSLEDITSLEKKLGIEKVDFENNFTEKASKNKESTWAEKSLTLKTSITQNYALAYHASALEGEIFLESLLAKLNDNPNAKSLILGTFVNELFNHSEKEILSSLIYTRRLSPGKLEILCKGHSASAATLLGEIIQREYKKAIALEEKTRPLLPSLHEKLKSMLQLEKEAAEIKVYLSSMLEDNPNESIEAMALRSEILQLDNDIDQFRNSLIKIDSIHNEKTSPRDYLNIKRVQEYGKVSEYSHIYEKLEQMSKDKKLNELTKAEVIKNLHLTGDSLNQEIILAINFMKERVSELLQKKSSLQQELADHILSKKTLITQDPRVKKLNFIRDELAKTQESYEDELLRWMNCKNSFEIHKDS